MSEVKVIPNLPPALAERIRVMVGQASCLEAGPFHGIEAERLAEEIKVAVAEAWDAREAPLFAHLRNLSYNLGQVVNDGKPGAWEHHLESAQRAVDNILRLLEQHR